jgi:hypothetical protein
MTILIIMKKPSAFLPIAMSVTALAVILIYIAMHSSNPQPDEGLAAHLWQLLMVLQIPIIVFFAIRWISQSPRLAVIILVLQIIAALAALTPIFLLSW